MGVVVRSVRSGDWPAVHRLADASLTGVTDAPSQREWLESRRSFVGERTHHVAEEARSVVGYCSVERQDGEPEGAWRVFVVTEWAETPHVAEVLYEQVEADLERSGATGAWMREYESDTDLLQFFADRGFATTERYDLDGVMLVNLWKPLPVQPA